MLRGRLWKDCRSVGPLSRHWWPWLRCSPARYNSGADMTGTCSADMDIPGVNCPRSRRLADSRRRSPVRTLARPTPGRSPPGKPPGRSATAQRSSPPISNSTPANARTPRSGIRTRPREISFWPTRPPLAAIPEQEAATRARRRPEPLMSFGPAGHDDLALAATPCQKRSEYLPDTPHKGDFFPAFVTLELPRCERHSWVRTQ